MAEITVTEEEKQAVPEAEALPPEDAASPEPEEESADEEAEEARRTSRFARGCLEVGAGMLVLAGLFMLLESKAHICLFYTWPPHVLSLACMAGSFLSLMVGLFALGKNAFAMLVMILSGWTVLLVLAFVRLQDPETMQMPIPGTERTAVMTLVSTPGSATLYIDEPMIWGVLSRHWALPVHDRNLPLVELVELEEQEDTVQLIFNGRLWAVYDPERNTWADVLHHEAAEEPTEAAS